MQCRYITLSDEAENGNAIQSNSESVAHHPIGLLMLNIHTQYNMLQTLLCILYIEDERSIVLFSVPNLMHHRPRKRRSRNKLRTQVIVKRISSETNPRLLFEMVQLDEEKTRAE